MRRSLLFGAAIAIVATIAARSLADAPAFTLDWQAPSECPHTLEVQDEVRRLLGPSTVGHASLSAIAVATKSSVSDDPSSAWRVDLTTSIDGATGRRTLFGPTCNAIAHATALVVALAIDPSRALSVETSDAAPSVDSSSSAYPPADGGEPDARAAVVWTPNTPSNPPPLSDAGAPDAPSSAPVPVASSTFLFGAGAAADIGTLPRVALAPVLTAGWLGKAARVDARLLYFPSVRHMIDETRGGEFTFLVGGLRGCWTFGSADATIGPCVFAEGGSLHGEGIGLRFPRSGGAPWVGVGASGLGSLRLGPSPLWLTLAIEAEIPLSRPQFGLDDRGLVHQPSAVTGRASLGGEIRF